MQVNRINKFYIAIAVLLIGIHIYRVIHYRSWDRYYYFTNICAPAAYPVYVRDAYFITGNGDMSSIRNMEINNFQTNWKAYYFFPETHEKELLPGKLVLKYVSYRDQHFYRDTIDLPVDSIRTLADKIMTGRQAEDIYYRGRDVPGIHFLIGIANDGYILVWLKGADAEHLVVRTRIQPVIPTSDDTYYGEPMTPDAYIKDRFMGLDDSLKAQIQLGWEAGAQYRDSL